MKLNRYKLFHEWQDKVVVGESIGHALIGRTLFGGQFYRNGSPLPMVQVAIASLHGTRANPNSRRGDQNYETALVLDEKGMAHEIDYRDLGDALTWPTDAPYSRP